MSVLSIQSVVSDGHVGNAAAVPGLQRLGLEVWPVHTVHFSSHPGYAGWRGRVTTPEELDALLQGLRDSGVLSELRAIVTGYMGSPDTARAALSHIRELRASSPDLLYQCDPVLGDHGQLYVDPGLEALFLKEAAPVADVLVPNAFELGLLSGEGDLTTWQQALRGALTLGVEVVVATGLRLEPGLQTILVSTPEGVWRVDAPHLEGRFVGTGDLFAALLLGHRLRGLTWAECATLAAGSLTHVLEETVGLGRRELCVVGGGWHRPHHGVACQRM